jgi:hypothetical protein
MNINLRKANAIQKQILDIVGEIELPGSVTINEFQDPELEISNAKVTLMDNDRKRAMLTTALYNIRGLVDQANHESGISLILTKSALAEKRIQQVRELTKLSPVTALDVINGRLEKIKTRKSDEYYGRDEITSGVVGRKDIEAFKKELREIQKQKQKYADEVLELNVKTEVPLSEDTVKILTEAGIL